MLKVMKQHIFISCQIPTSVGTIHTLPTLPISPKNLIARGSSKELSKPPLAPLSPDRRAGAVCLARTPKGPRGRAKLQRRRDGKIVDFSPWGRHGEDP